MANDIDFKKRLRIETVIVRILSLTATAVALFILIGIILYVFSKGLPEINWKFLTTEPSFLDQTFGILPLIINTLYLVVIGLMISLPIGIGGALFLSEYSKQGRIIGIIRFTIEILTGLPSIIFGLFGALFFVVFFGFGDSILAGSCTLAIMTLPVIIRTTEESLKSVDHTYREAALSMGVSRFHIIKTILIPCAIPGIITAVVLAIGRMVGDSASLLFTAGMGYNMPIGFFEHARSGGASLTVQLFLFFNERPPGSTEATPFAIAAVLMIIVLILNTITGFIGMRFKKGNNS
jgi:phosphate transport system permease protein